MSDDAPITGADVAAALRPRIGQIAEEVAARYGRYYPHSAGTDMDQDFVICWTTREVSDFLDCVATGSVNSNYASWEGDTATVHFDMVSPLANRLEMILLYAEVCAEFLWEEYVVEATRLPEAVATFERCVARLFADDAAQYAKANLTDGALEKTWRLGPRSAAGRPAASSQAPQDFSQRQLQIVRFVAEGRSNGEIAAALGISAHTVRNHLATIFDKLNVNNRTELALKATRDGLLD